MTTPTPPTELPAAVAVPDPNDQTTFDGRMFSFISWVSALIPSLGAALANVYNNALSAFTSASAAGNSAANSASYAGQAQAWATQTGSEVVAGQGFGAKKYAQDAAISAQQAAASVAALPAGTINDGAPSPTAAYSSQKVAADYLAKTGGTLTGPVTGRILGVQGPDVASAAAINLTSAAGGTVDVTGSVSISSITLPAGAECEVRFTGAPLLVNGASLVLKGGANIQAAAGDYAVFRGYAGGVVRCVFYDRASGSSVAGLSVGDHEVTVHTGNGVGSTNTAIRKFTTTLRNVGTAITYASTAAAGASFTINESGLYEIYYSDVAADAIYWFGVTLNSSQLTTSVDTITDISVRVMAAQILVATRQNTVTRTVRLAAGDVIRPHVTNGFYGAADTKTHFSVRKVGV